MSKSLAYGWVKLTLISTNSVNSILESTVKSLGRVCVGVVGKCFTGKTRVHSCFSHRGNFRPTVGQFDRRVRIDHPEAVFVVEVITF